MSLWTSSEAIAATGGTTGEWVANGVSIDTRTLQKGDLFVALTDIRDGHDFVAQALENGAAAAMASRVPDGVDRARLLLVTDVLEGLEALGKAARKRAARVIAVTGSVGKTGTKEMLRTALNGQGRVHAAEKSYNNHWGVPLTLARMPTGTDFAIIEIGMNHPGEIGPLAKMVEPDVAVITNVAAVHMEAFQSVAEIAVEKAAIFEGLRAGGHAILNTDLDSFDILRDAANAAGAEITTFGSDADFRLIDVKIGDGVTNVSAEPISFTLGAEGRHFAMNALAVLAAVKAAGGNVGKSTEALQNWHAPVGRGERWLVGNITLIDDSYNANPMSVGAALDVLANSKERRVAILGDMLELGDMEIARHKELAALDCMKDIEQVHCIGPLMKALYDVLPADKRGEWFASSTELAQNLETLLKDHDTVMVKGSLGAKMAVVVDAIKNMGDARRLSDNGGVA